MQRRRHSIAEAVVNTAVGFFLSNLLWPVIQILVLHQPYRASQGLEVVGVFTVLSVVRNYWVRRMFNHTPLMIRTPPAAIGRKPYIKGIDP